VQYHVIYDMLKIFRKFLNNYHVLVKAE